MRLMQTKKYEILVSLASLGMLAYLGWQGSYGARGYSYRDTLTAMSENYRAESKSILAQRLALEAKVKLMRPESIDPDYLDELARRDLFLVNPTDVVVEFSN